MIREVAPQDRRLTSGFVPVALESLLRIAKKVDKGPWRKDASSRSVIRLRRRQVERVAPVIFPKFFKQFAFVDIPGLDRLPERAAEVLFDLFHTVKPRGVLKAESSEISSH